MNPPRLEVDAAGPARGSKGAPVTIVEFADFPCPYCARLAPTLKRLQESYRGKVRLVFKHFPVAIHEDAAKAAEAAECAQEQGRFWAMHDKLFQKQADLGIAALQERAGELGLDGKRFRQCLASGKYASRWRADMEQGRTYGVRGAPTFFVNGRVLTGAPTRQSLTGLIEDELARVGAGTRGTGRSRE